MEQKKEIDWEQRHYEVTKEAMKVLMLKTEMDLDLAYSEKLKLCICYEAQQLANKMIWLLRHFPYKEQKLEKNDTVNNE